jgi:hypothetical protein
MDSSWHAAESLLGFDALADVLGERHRIIADDWLAARVQTLIARLLERAAEMLDRIDFTPAALRVDLAGDRVVPRRLRSAAEMLARAADLCGESARLVHDNERRWRVFRDCAAELLDIVRGQVPTTPAGRSSEASPTSAAEGNPP